MEINTARFGKLIINSDNTLTFESPILGFEGFKQFVIISQEDGPFEFIQSLDDEQLTFVATDPFLFCPEYDFTLDNRWLELLQIEREEQLTVRSIVTVRSPLDISINLQAPLVMNREKLTAAQVVLDRSDFGPRYPIMSPEEEGLHADSIKE